jgi:hypothetical protein
MIKCDVCGKTGRYNYDISYNDSGYCTYLMDLCRDCRNKIDTFTYKEKNKCYNKLSKKVEKYIEKLMEEKNEL